jgi:hypothetical protein
MALDRLAKVWKLKWVNNGIGGPKVPFSDESRRGWGGEGTGHGKIAKALKIGCVGLPRTGDRLIARAGDFPSYDAQLRSFRPEGYLRPVEGKGARAKTSTRHAGYR